MQQYLDLLDRVLTTGAAKEDRTGTGTLSVFGHQMRFDLAQGFPAVTTKRLHMRSVIGELLWFLRGSTNVAWLQEQGVTIWDEWADPTGELGPVYGYQWRSWPTPDGRHVDQIAAVIEAIRTNPDSRRHLVSAWNVADLGRMALPPCHTMFQFYVARRPALLPALPAVGRRLPRRAVQHRVVRAAHAMVAQVTDLEPGDFVHTLGDAHLYTNHVDQAREQLTREPRPLPTMTLNPSRRSIDEFDDGRLHARGLRPAPGDQGAHRRMTHGRAGR